MNNRKQQKIGRIVSAQMKDTVVVSVDAFVSHPLYQKKIRRTRRFLAHNPEGKAKLGDTVTIEENRPISKRKHWLVIDIQPNQEIIQDDLEATLTETI